MKRLMALMTALVLMCWAAPALAAAGGISYARVVEMALHVREMANGDYLSLKGVPEKMQNVARGWTAGIDDTPDMVIRLDVGDCAHVLEYRAMFKSEHEMVGYEAESTGVGEIINYAMVMAAYESVVAESAYSEIAEVNTALNLSTLRAAEGEEEGTALYVVLYEGAQPLFILTRVENGAVALSAWIIPSRQLSGCTSYAQVAMWFMRWGCPISGAEIRAE